MSQMSPNSSPHANFMQAMHISKKEEWSNLWPSPVFGSSPAASLFPVMSRLCPASLQPAQIRTSIPRIRKIIDTNTSPSHLHVRLRAHVQSCFRTNWRIAFDKCPEVVPGTRQPCAEHFHAVSCDSEVVRVHLSIILIPEILVCRLYKGIESWIWCIIIEKTNWSKKKGRKKRKPGLRKLSIGER